MTDVTHPEDEERMVLSGTFRDYFGFLKSEWETLKWLFKEVTTTESRRHMGYMLALLILSTAFIMVQPALVASAVHYIAAKDLYGIVYSIAAFALLAMLHHIVSYKEGGEREWVLGLNMCRIDECISEYLFSKPLGQHERHGTKLNYASIDKGKWKAVQLMDMLVFQGVPSLMMSICALIGLFVIRPEFGLFALLVSCAFYGWSLWLNYQVGFATHPIEREFRRINRIRVERWEKVHRVTTSGVAQKEISRLSNAMETNMAKDRAFWTWIIGQFNLRSFLLQRLLSIAALGYGSYLVYNGEWELGYLFPLTVWAEALNNNLMMLSHVERNVGRDIVPVQLMIEALKLEPAFDMYAGTPLKRNGPLKVRFNNVSYSYLDERGEEHPVLRNICLGIEVGEKVALLGPSGAGKTTLMKLLLRYDDPTKGVVLINNQKLHKLELASYMRQVGYIPQTAMILDGTLKDNLLYGVSGRRREELLDNEASLLWDLMQSLKIDFGTRLQHGLDTLVGRHGLKLSGGQAQRVMIGAAVAKSPRLMVIDEATSSLDSTTEREVQEGLAAALKEGTTALIVAHRLSTVRTLCDRFVVIRPIEMLGEGESQIEAVASSFEELARISPTFRQLAKDQGVFLE